MLALMLLRVVGVNCVSHICREEETLVDGLVVGILVESCKATENTLSALDKHVAVCALGRAGTDLLVIK